MKLKSYILFYFLSFYIIVSAQSYQQSGTVRMITSSSESPIVPVSGVKLVIDNVITQPTGEDGRFTASVTKQFSINEVVPSPDYILVMPTKGKEYTRTPNDICVVVTTKQQQEQDYKKLYIQIKAKYDAQYDSVCALRQSLKELISQQSISEREYAQLQARLDSVQTLYLDYINNEEKVDKVIREIASELSITDYQTLDSLDQHIYDLKCKGEWKTITNLLHDVMHGDAAAYLQEGIDNEKTAKARLEEAEEENRKADATVDEHLGKLKLTLE